MKQCPFCAEEIQDAAVVCKHCGRDLVSTATAQQVQIVQPAKQGTGCLTKALAGVFALVVAVFLAAQFSPDTSPKDLLPAHREAIATALSARGFTQPNRLTLESTGFVVADWEVPETLAIPHRRFGEDRLLAIREALLPFGFKYYRVNVNGPPPGTGMIRRYGSARLTGDSSVEWLRP